METVEIFKQYLEQLFQGQRNRAREIIFGAHDRGFGSERLLSLIIWPAMEQIERLHRENHISQVVENMATRINRMIADQVHAVLNRKPKDGRRIVVLCGDEESAELGAQMTSDLFEAEGWTVWFIGSGVANDDVLQFLGRVDPNIMLVFGSLAAEVPNVRRLITLIREVGICEQMQVMVCGGVYNRAEDLAEEIKADLFAHHIREALFVAQENPIRVPRPDVPEPGRRRKRKRRVQDPHVQKLREVLNTEGAHGAQSEERLNLDNLIEDPTDAELAAISK